jgi:ABC-type Co2+ transport system permease subunit
MYSIIHKMLDIYEFIKRILRYCVMGLVIAVVSLVAPRKPLSLEEITFIALSAASVFAILDTFAPSIGKAARNGVGFGVGTGLIGGLPMHAM